MPQSQGDTRARLTVGESGQVYWSAGLGVAAGGRSVGGSRRIFDGLSVSGFHRAGQTLCTLSHAYSFPSQPLHH
jgi:hypothetical protein